MSSWEPDATLVATLKKAAAALRDAGVPFAVGGGFAAWARGAPPTEHDVDLFICESDIATALDTLAAAGMRTECPPEGWLVKAWDGDVLVDLIFAPSGFDVTPTVLARSEVLNVVGMEMLVLPAADIFVSRLLALSEHQMDFAGLLPLARALREKVDWVEVRARVESSAYARGFLYLLEELEIIPSSTEPAQPMLENPVGHRTTTTR
ncbi:MAG: nucleotidyltransferase [Acidimicrobiia bacterium]